MMILHDGDFCREIFVENSFLDISVKEMNFIYIVYIVLVISICKFEEGAKFDAVDFVLLKLSRNFLEINHLFSWIFIFSN